MVGEHVPGSRMRSRGMPAIDEGDETNADAAPNLDGDFAHKTQSEALKNEVDAFLEAGDAGHDVTATKHDNADNGSI